jgi:hypothetical protein
MLIVLGRRESGDVGYVYGNIQGQYPSTRKTHESYHNGYAFITVPLHFKIYPSEIPSSQNQMCDTSVPASYSIVRSVASIMQIVFASKELYDSRGLQIDNYGYTAYSLTVFPYLWMSFINLLYTLCERQYPESLIVLYRGIETPRGTKHVDSQSDIDKELEGQITGHVGIIYGDWKKEEPKVCISMLMFYVG